MLTGPQIRAARAMLRMEQSELARVAGVSKPTIARLEKSEGMASGHVSTLQAIKSALEAAGVEFIPENGGGPGLRMKMSGSG